MFRKLFAVLLALIVAALAVAAVALVRAAGDRALRDIEARLDGHVEVLRFLRRQSPETLAADARRLGEALDTRFTVIDGGGVIVDSHADPIGMEDHANRPEVREARLTGRGMQRRDPTSRSGYGDGARGGPDPAASERQASTGSAAGSLRLRSRPISLNRCQKTSAAA